MSSTSDPPAGTPGDGRNESRDRTVRIVAIDGPAGCGKSTVVRLLAEALASRGVAAIGFSTGSVYRALTWATLERGVDPSEGVAVRRVVDEVTVRIVERSRDDGVPDLRVEVDGVDPGDALRSTRVTEAIHWIADDPEIRRALLPLQRDLPVGPVILSEGRDLGTVVYPDAPVKVFLTASLEERARRRHAEFRDRLGEEISLEEVQERVRVRDEHDSSRDVAPLRPADDAQVIDTTTLSPEEVVAAILARIPAEWLPPSGGPRGGGGSS